MKRNRFIITVMAVFLMIAMMPMTASAASKKTVYVITKLTKDSTGQTITYTYNKKGLVKGFKEVVQHGSDDPSVTKAKCIYDKKNRLTKIKFSMDAGSYTTTYKYNKKGLLIKGSYSGLNAQPYYYAYEYDSKKRLTEIYCSDPDLRTTIKCDSKGRITEGSNKLCYTLFSYDNKGNVKLGKHHDNSSEDDAALEVTRYENNYQKGRLVKRVMITDGETKNTITITYKKMKVKKSYVKAVKAQQKLSPNDPTVGLFSVDAPFWFNMH